VKYIPNNSINVDFKISTVTLSEAVNVQRQMQRRQNFSIRL